MFDDLICYEVHTDQANEKSFRLLFYLVRVVWAS